MLFSVLYKICDLTRYNFKPIEIHVDKQIARYSALYRLKHSKYVIILIIVMPKINLEDALDEEELEEYGNKYDYCYFESFYGTCDHFDNPDEYPYHDKVSANTKQKNIPYDNFYDQKSDVPI